MDKWQSKTVYRISDIGTCPRALGAERLGKTAQPFPEFLKLAAEEGNWHETRIKNEMQAEGYELEYWDECPICKKLGQERRGIHVEMEYPTFRLVGHMDGVVKSGIMGVLEIKSMSQREFDRWMKDRFAAFPHYLAQVVSYMRGSGLPFAYYRVKNRNSGYQDKLELCLKDYSELFPNLVGKLVDVEAKAQKGELIDIAYNPESIECQRCPWAESLCIPAPVVLNEVDKDVLERVIGEWRKNIAIKEQAQEQIANAVSIIKRYTEEQPTHKIKLHNISASIVSFNKKDYPQEELLKIFSESQLKPALKIIPVSYCKIVDFQKE